MIDPYQHTNCLASNLCTSGLGMGLYNCWQAVFKFWALCLYGPTPYWPWWLAVFKFRPLCMYGPTPYWPWWLRRQHIAKIHGGMQAHDWSTVKCWNVNYSGCSCNLNRAKNYGGGFPRVIASCSGHVEEGKVFLSCMASGFKRLIPGTRFEVQLVSIPDRFPAHNSGSIIYDRWGLGMRGCDATIFSFD